MLACRTEFAALLMMGRMSDLRKAAFRRACNRLASRQLA
jgi:hypothetical protein